MGNKLICVEADLDIETERTAFLAAVPNRDEVAQFLAVDDQSEHVASYVRFYTEATQTAAYVASTGKHITYLAVADIDHAQSDKVAGLLGGVESWSEPHFRRVVEIAMAS